MTPASSTRSRQPMGRQRETRRGATAAATAAMMTADLCWMAIQQRRRHSRRPRLRRDPSRRCSCLGRTAPAGMRPVRFCATAQGAF